MADINVQRRNNTPWLWWIIGLIIVALILWWVIAAMNSHRREATPEPVNTVPTATAPATGSSTAPPTGGAPGY